MQTQKIDSLNDVLRECRLVFVDAIAKTTLELDRVHQDYDNCHDLIIMASKELCYPTWSAAKNISRNSIVVLLRELDTQQLARLQRIQYLQTLLQEIMLELKRTDAALHVVCLVLIK